MVNILGWWNVGGWTNTSRKRRAARLNLRPDILKNVVLEPNNAVFGPSPTVFPVNNRAVNLKGELDLFDI